jgi:hypothetical protein
MPRTYHLAAPIGGSSFFARVADVRSCNEQSRHTALAKRHRGLEPDGVLHALLATVRGDAKNALKLGSRSGALVSSLFGAPGGAGAFSFLHRE